MTGTNHFVGRGPQEVRTDPRLLVAVADMFGPITFDVAASRDNAVASAYFTERDDALVHDWPMKGINWCNPPFSMFGKFTRKAWEQKQACVECSIVLAIASLATNWWQAWVHDKALVMPINRPRFVGHEHDFPKDMALLIYSPSLAPGYEPRWNWKD
jgi:phage N-6-adenine-methyltransferase